MYLIFIQYTLDANIYGIHTDDSGTTVVFSHSVSELDPGSISIQSAFLHTTRSTINASNMKPDVVPEKETMSMIKSSNK